MKTLNAQSTNQSLTVVDHYEFRDSIQNATEVQPLVLQGGLPPRAPLRESRPERPTPCF